MFDYKRGTPTSAERRLFEAMAGNSLLVLPDPPLYTILSATEGMMQRSGLSAEQLINIPFFEAFPANDSNPDDPNAAVQNLVLESFEYIAQHKKPHDLPIVRYDLASDEGVFTASYWKVHNRPLLDEEGNLRFIIHTSFDVTGEVTTLQKEEKLQAIEITEKRLRESNERFVAAVKATNGILWTNNAIGEMEGEQPGWSELTGQTLEEYQGYGWTHAVHPEDVQGTVEAWNDAVRERKMFVFEHRLQIKNGDWGTFSIRAIPLLNDDNSIREWVGVHTNITEQKNAEQRLRESEERFRNLADESPIFIFIIDADPDAPVSYWNRTWLEYTGQTWDEAVGKAWNGIIHPDDIAIVMEFYLPAFESRQSYFIPAVRVKRHDGEYRWYSFEGNPRYLHDGSFNGYVGVGFDIHEQKLAQDLVKQNEALLQVKVVEGTTALQEHQHLLNNIMTNSSNGISVTEMVRNEKGEVIDALTILANDAAITLTGLPKEIYFSKKATELDPLILQSPYGQLCLNTLKTGEPGVIRYYLEVTRRWLELSISKMDDDHLIHIFTDVTAIKKAQLEMEYMVEELKRSNTNLQEFAYAASHDLKEPIRKIQIFTERIKESLDGNLSREAVGYFSRLEVASKRMGTLIDDLLSYSHVSLRPRAFEEVDLNQLFDLVMNDLDLEIDEKKASIKISTLGVVKGHHRQLQQAFQNLLTNALKYSKPATPPIINITSNKVQGKDVPFTLLPGVEKANQFLMIRITDNGIGFDPGDAERIFNVFTRLHGNVEYRGTGVGLAIVRKVIENHNGLITAEGKPGEGAVFRIYLPLD